MIEKFSNEELEQIMEELGIKKHSTKPYTLALEQRKEVREIFKDKPCFSGGMPASRKIESHIRSIIAITLNYIVKSKKGNWITSTSIKANDTKEYEEMYSKFLEIIKLHNREWERD